MDLDESGISGCDDGVEVTVAAADLVEQKVDPVLELWIERKVIKVWVESW